jgi:putative peptidoglycan lipid II flippase
MKAALPQPGGLVRSVATVGSMTMLSRVAGFARDILVAALLGAGPLADAFFVAFKLPNFLRRLFAEGAFNAGFVPMFARTLEAEGKLVARAFAEQAQAVMIAILLPLVIVAIAIMPLLIRLFAPGFDTDGVRYGATVDYARITFCYILFISLVALYGGVLNSIGRFAAPAAAPVVLNLVLILALLLSAAWFDAPSLALAWGVAIAGLAQFLWLRVSLAREGMTIGLRRPRLTPEIRRLFSLIIPGAIGAGVAQISLLADVFFASLLPAGAVSYLYFADRLAQLPLGVIGVAVGTALLPLLARQLRAGQIEGALASQNRAIELALLLTLPSALALIVLGRPIVTVLFERGAFDPAASTATAAALVAYALGLPAFVLVKVLAPGFFAREDTRTPVKIAILCLGANVVLVLALLWWLEHVGIALATTLASWLNASLLAWHLRRAGLLKPDQRLKTRLVRIAAAAFGMTAVLLLLLELTRGLPAWLALIVQIGAGGLSFFALAQALGAMQLSEIRSLVRRDRA